MKGFVLWFDAKKGYGFITGEDKQSYFVHFKDVQREGFRTLHEGEKVEFLVEASPKGKKALDVKVI